MRRPPRRNGRPQTSIAQPVQAMNEVDVYPVGWLEAWKHHGMAREWRYMVRQVKARKWRAVRSTFNGYLCEHTGHPHNAGRGWTKRAATRRAERLCGQAGSIT